MKKQKCNERISEIVELINKTYPKKYNYNCLSCGVLTKTQGWCSCQRSGEERGWQ